MILRRGQLLVEAMIAVAVVLVGLLAIMQISRKSVNNSSFSDRQATATAYATQAMEWVNDQKNNLDWIDLFGKGNGSGIVYCLNSSDLDWNSGPCPNFSLGGLYKRELMVKTVSNNVQVRVTISWPEGSRTAQVSQETILSKY